MQNLNKSNYFDQLKEKYPKAVELFCSWVDRYKNAVNWNTMFGGDLIKSPKFHDLPYELQYGILLRFFAEHGRLVFLPPTEAGEWFETIFASIERGTLGLSGIDITSPGANSIFMERMRQIELEGFDADHDKANEKGELSIVAAILITGDATNYPTWWSKSWLEKALEQPEKIRKIWAGALIAADLDRMIEDEKLKDEPAGNN